MTDKTHKASKWLSLLGPWGTGGRGGLKYTTEINLIPLFSEIIFSVKNIYPSRRRCLPVEVMQRSNIPTITDVLALSVVSKAVQ